MGRGKKETRATDVGLGMQVNSWWCNAHGVYHRGLSSSLQQFDPHLWMPLVCERLTGAASPPSLQPAALTGRLQQQAVIISWSICLEVCE